MSSLAIDTDWTEMDALLALAPADRAMMLAGRVSLSTKPASNSASAPGSLMSKGLAIRTLGRGRCRVKLFYSHTLAKDKELLPDSSHLGLLSGKGNAGTSSGFGLSILLTCQPVRGANHVMVFELGIEQRDLSLQVMELVLGDISRNVVNSNLEPGFDERG